MRKRQKEKAMKKFKAIATKVAIKLVRFVWLVVGLAITFYTFFVTAVTLGECITDGTPTWVRLVIGLPCIFFTTLGVEFLYIEISRRLDSRLTDNRVLGIRRY